MFFRLAGPALHCESKSPPPVLGRLNVGSMIETNLAKDLAISRLLLICVRFKDANENWPRRCYVIDMCNQYHGDTGSVPATDAR